MSAEDKARLLRIEQMEESYDRICAAVEELEHAIENYISLQEEISSLEKYYEGPEWLDDFDADREGKIPKDMKRGILTEDAIYDLLMEKQKMLQMLGELV